MLRAPKHNKKAAHLRAKPGTTAHKEMMTKLAAEERAEKRAEK